MSRPSRHLTFDGNQKVFGMLGNRKESLSSAVIQLLFGTNTQPSTWQLQMTGVICFVKDPIRKGFFFEVFDIDADQSVWEQELYNEIDYKRKDKLFHCFEGDSAYVGISFMDEMEANHFHEKVQERISKRRARASQYYSSKPHTVEERRRKKSDRKSKSSKKKGPDRSSSNANSLWNLWRKDKKDVKPKLSPSDISGPDSSTFKHLQGVKPSFEGSGGFEMVDNTEDLDNMDPRIKEFLMIAGLDEKVMANPKKAKKVKVWAEQNNVYDIMDRSTGVKPSGAKAASRPTRPPPRPRGRSEGPVKGGVLPAPPPPPPPISDCIKRESIKRSSANFMAELGEKKLTPARQPNPIEAEPLDEGDRGLDDLIKDALARFRDDINESSDSDSEDDNDEDSGWSDN